VPASLVTRADAPLAALAARMDELQARWPGSVRLDIEAASSIYDYHPYLFVEAFPPLPERSVESLALAARLFANFVFLSDASIDGAAEPGFGSIAPLRASAMQYETYRILAGLFPAGSSFWQRFGGYLRGLAEACVIEAEFGSGRRDWSEFTESVAREVAVKKAAIAKASVAGLAALAGERGPLTELEASIDHYNAAHQLFDDLGDWKKDLRRRQPSLILARLLPDGGPFRVPEPSSELMGRVSRDLYYRGHAHHVLSLALLELDAADRALTGLGAIAWSDAVAGLRRRCLDLDADIFRIVAENTNRIRSQPEVRLTKPPAAGGLWEELAWKALEHTLKEWRRGFGEARHLMRFPRSQGFSGESEIQTGDVFQRALLSEALCEAQALAGSVLQPAIDHEVGYLLRRAIAAPPAGWSYFPDLPELPGDADDLAQVMRVLLLAGRRQEIAARCEPALGVLLDAGSHPDGSFETWIVPRGLDTPLSQRQREFVELAWGSGPDPEVMANLLHALHVYDAKRFAGEIERGLDFIERVQEPDGSWTSTWYPGPFYGAFAAVRVLGIARPGSVALPRALDFLRSRALPGGGWSVGVEPDALSTSLALLALASAPSGVCAEDDRRLARQAADFLTAVHRETDGWSGCPFVQMNPGRATGGQLKTVYYSSRTITTAFVLRAAVAWKAAEAARC
jgi:squalene-hopene/tetraprenyl-beta-curcumene cyclase